VRSRDGRVVELRNVVRTELGAAPSSITRHQRQRSVTISANLDGIRMEAGVEGALAIGAEILPPNVTSRWPATPSRWPRASSRPASRSGSACS
jgi:multidrug efflux pump subunit AcrB